jgi:hypothetical protein
MAGAVVFEMHVESEHGRRSRWQQAHMHCCSHYSIRSPHQQAAFAAAVGAGVPNIQAGPWALLGVCNCFDLGMAKKHEAYEAAICAYVWPTWCVMVVVCVCGDERGGGGDTTTTHPGGLQGSRLEHTAHGLSA